jgi:membrane associated rhomboid family serine protease
MSCLIQPSTVSVGASGAILGLVGAYFAYIILIWKKLDPREKKMQVIQAFFILLVLGLLSLAPYLLFILSCEKHMFSIRFMTDTLTA